MEKVTVGELGGVDLQKLFDEFRHVCDSLEGGEVLLGEAISLYARGVELSAQISAVLDSADRRVVEIVDADGKISPFEKKP